MAFWVTSKPQPTLSVNTNITVSLLFTRRLILYMLNKNRLTIQPPLYRLSS